MNIIKLIIKSVAEMFRQIMQIMCIYLKCIMLNLVIFYFPLKVFHLTTDQTTCTLYSTINN